MALTAILFGSFRGLHEGMIMALDGDWMHTGLFAGVRGHVGFEVYHAIGFFAPILGAALALMVFIWRPRNRLPGWRWLLFVLGLLVLIWEATELGYGYARWGAPIGAVEHINFADIVSLHIRGWTVWAIHALRTAAGSTFILTGGIR